MSAARRASSTSSSGLTAGTLALFNASTAPRSSAVSGRMCTTRDRTGRSAPLGQGAVPCGGRVVASSRWRSGSSGSARWARRWPATSSPPATTCGCSTAAPDAMAARRRAPTPVASAAAAAAGADVRVPVAARTGRRRGGDRSAPTACSPPTRAPAFVVDLSTSSPDVVRRAARALRRGRRRLRRRPGVGRQGEGRVGRAERDGRRRRRRTSPPSSRCCRRSPPRCSTSVRRVPARSPSSSTTSCSSPPRVLVQEAYVLGAAAGLDPPTLHRIVRASSGGPYAALAPLLLGRDFDDVIFRLDIATKDLDARRRGRRRARRRRAR